MTVKQKYVFWKEDMWMGYLEKFPDYWTQGETKAELQENLIDLYEVASRLSAVLKHGKRPIR